MARNLTDPEVGLLYGCEYLICDKLLSARTNAETSSVHQVSLNVESDWAISLNARRSPGGPVFSEYCVLPPLTAVNRGVVW